MIDCENLSASYGKQQVLSGLTFCAQDAQITILLGINGSGKSTIVKCIQKHLPFQGTITVDGIAPGKALARTLGILPQILPSPPVSVKELVSYGRTPYAGFYGFLGAKDQHIIQDAIDKMDLSEFAERSVATLSGGQRQNAFLAMLLAQDTQNVLLDEPVTYMDIACEKRFYQFIHNLRESGKCVLLILHNIASALENADKIIVLDKGCAAFTGTPEECVQSGILETVFGVHAEKILLHGEERYLCT